MSKNHSMVFTILNYIEHFLMLVSAIAGCFQFLHLPLQLVFLTSSVLALKIWEIIVATKK